MITLTRSFEWDMGHRVTNHASLCKNPHGHRYRMIVEISGIIKNQSGASDDGMIIDFGDLKTLVQTEIVDGLDHSFVYWSQDAVMKTFAQANPGLRMRSIDTVPTAENLVEYVATELSGLLSSRPGLTLESIELFETPKSSAIWKRT